MSIPRAIIQIGHKKPYPFTPFGSGTRGEVTYSSRIASLLTDELLQRGWDTLVVPAAYDFSARADVFISLHCDGNNNSTARGFSIGYHPDQNNSNGSHVLGLKLNEIYEAGTTIPSRGFNYTNDQKYYYAFKRVQHIPAAILFEMGFLTNPDDKKYLTENQLTVARLIADSIAGKPPIANNGDDDEMQFDRGTYKSGNWIVDVNTGNHKFKEMEDTSTIFHNPKANFRRFTNGMSVHGYSDEGKNWIIVYDYNNNIVWKSPKESNFSIAGVMGAEVYDKTLVIPYIYI